MSTGQPRQPSSTSTTAASVFTLEAWVDESIHTPGPDVPEGMYVLAATVADPAACDPTREALRALVAKGASRLHWRDESEGMRRDITAAIASCDLISTVVVGARLDQARQERARRKCMQRLLHELELLEVGQVWLESRTASLNRKDIQLIDALRGEGAVSRRLRVDFGLPSQEPMLWVSDAIAGAVSSARKGVEPAHRHKLAGLVTEYDIVL